MEIRLHGRGGQGGVTCAKLLAAIYADLGKHVQAFGDYAGERSGAPIRAYTRVDDAPIENRNKVYHPDHLLVLDPTLLDDSVVSGLQPGGVLLLNTPQAPEELASHFPGFRIATVDATGIARRHGIGTRSVVIVNTTIAGAFARAMGIPMLDLEAAYTHMGLQSNLPAAREAYDAVRILDLRQERAVDVDGPAASAWGATLPGPVPDLVDQREGPAPALRTGSWRSQTPRYLDRPAPCNAACPAGNDVVRFVQALATQGPDAAAAVLAESTPLPGVCGRVCPAPCMSICNRAEQDGSVNIRAIERFLADHAPTATLAKDQTATPKDIVVVGAGPAGLSAVYQLARRGHKVTLYEREPKLGGVLVTGIPPYRLPPEVVAREVEAILDLGVIVHEDAVDGPKLAELQTNHDAVILATGLQHLTGLDVPGMQLDGIEQGIDFLHRINMHEQQGLPGHVVVIGGGNTAMDCARTALRAHAEKVTVVYRRTRAEMPAIAEEIEEAEAEGVQFRFLRGPVGFYGYERLGGVELATMELGPPDASGRQRPVDSGHREFLECDAVLLALGSAADISWLPDDWRFQEGRFHNGEKALNVWGCGDVTTNEGTVTHAIGDGRRIAAQVLSALGEAVPAFTRPPRADAVTPKMIHRDHFEPHARHEGGHLPPELRARTYEEVNFGLADGTEARRCYSCGLCTQCDTCLVYCPEGIIRRRAAGYTIDYDNCKGCGICVTECPRGAITMEAK